LISRRIKDILVVDIEHGNFNPEVNRYHSDNCSICEIGIVNLNFDTGVVDIVFNQTCREDKLGSPLSWVFKNTSLTYDEVTKSDNLRNFHEEIQEIFNTKPVTSWNQKFDFKTILEHPSRNFEIPLKFWDPMKVLTHYLKIPSSSGFGYKWPKLQEAFKYFNPGERLEQKHRAIDDAKIAAEIIFQAVKKWPELMNKWTDHVR